MWTKTRAVMWIFHPMDGLKRLPAISRTEPCPSDEAEDANESH